MDVRMSRTRMLKRLDRLGWDGLLALLDRATGFQLYQVSTDWARDGQFILKAKGGRGDLLVMWS